jgi:hypothetical protein
MHRFVSTIFGLSYDMCFKFLFVSFTSLPELLVVYPCILLLMLFIPIDVFLPLRFVISMI